jgi:hypothetical protein
MRFVRAVAALIAASAPGQISACEVAIRDAKSAISKIKKVFEPYKDSCRYENDGIQCLVTERSLQTSSMTMPGYVPGYMATIVFSASNEADKAVLASILVDHFVDRSPARDIAPRMLRAIEGGEALRVLGDTCTIAIQMKDGTLDIALIGPMVR